MKISKSNIEVKSLQKQVLFIGVDGASKRILDKMIKKNELKTIQKLIAGGSYVGSHSFNIGPSAPIWTSISTAKKPEKHGIRNFYGTNHNVTAKRIWEIFNDLGFPVGVFGHMVSWPPKKTEGFMIPDIMALDKQCYPEQYGFMWELTHKVKNEKRIKAWQGLHHLYEFYRYGISLSTLLQAFNLILKRKTQRVDQEDTAFLLRCIKTRFHADLFKHLHKTFKPVYSFMHIHLLDGCSHRFWKYMEPEQYDDISEREVHNHGHKIFDAYRFIDKMIHDIIASVDGSPLVVIASDHGFKAMDRPEHWGHKKTLNCQKFIDLFDPEIKRDLNFSLVLPRIHVSIRNVASQMNVRYKQYLQSIEVIEDKKPLFKVDEVDSVNFVLSFNREIKEISGKNILISGRVFPADEYLKTAQDVSSGLHDYGDGILILNGPDVKQNFRKEAPVTVYDIIPTILALCNLPVGKDMDGKVIEEVIEEDFLIKNPVRYIDTYEDCKEGDEKGGKSDLSDEETERLKGQLKDLGYL